MRLYSAPLSLFARKVEIALHEKGVAFERIMVPFSQGAGYSPKHPDVLAANPKGQVPVLVDGDLVVYNSTVILEYLEDAHPEPALYPDAPAARARCRLLELFADEILLAPVRALMHRNAPRADPDGWQRAERGAAEAEVVLDGHFAALDRRLGARRWLCDAFGAADIAMFTTVLYSQRLGGPPLDRHAALAAWFARLRDRPAFAVVVAEILAADRALSVPVPAAAGRL